jgi:hypothetical protein
LKLLEGGVPVIEITEITKRELKRQLEKSGRGVAVGA